MMISQKGNLCFSMNFILQVPCCCLVSVAVSLVLCGIWKFKKPFANDMSDDDKFPFLDIQMGLLDTYSCFLQQETSLFLSD